MSASETVVVVGGLGLLGRSVTASLRESGCDVYVSDIAEQSGCADDDRYICTDVTSERSIRDLIEQVDAMSGGFDALVNCAYPRNASYGKSLDEVDLASFNENVSLNAGSCFAIGKNFSQYFREKRGGGSLVFIGSIYGVVAPKFDIYDGTNMTMPVEYAFIKAGLVHFVKYLAKYLKGSSVRVNMVSPGGIENGQDEKFLRQYAGHCLTKGMLNADDLCGAIKLLIGQESRYINGQNIIVDDGFTL